MKLRPGKPKGLMSAQIVSIGIYRPHATPVENEPHIFEGNGFTPSQGIECAADVERQGFARLGHHTEDVLLHW